jgi:predicted RNA-binding Zn-ribbon protein involved in translation (DUF1610 family)
VSATQRRVKSDFHAHQCPDCLKLWEHDGAALLTPEEKYKAHLCPVCGHEQRLRWPSEFAGP